MAKRRMFSNEIIDTDKFLNMPLPAQALYFHFGMHADDDGFLASPNKTMRSAGANNQAYRQLLENGYIFEFDSGVIVITDWKINNSIQGDRYHPTIHIEEKAQLDLDSRKRYMYTNCIQNGNADKATLVKATLGKSCPSDFNKYKEEFEEVWAEYPRKEGKKNALEYYIRARKAGTSKDEILDGVKRYAAHVRQQKTETKYIRMGSTFMSKESWTDEYAVKQVVGVVDDSELLEGILA